MKICPFCHQDAVWHVRLKSEPKHSFLMCFECDSVWLEGQTVSDQAGTTFDRYMESLGRNADWSDIEKEKPVE